MFLRGLSQTKQVNIIYLIVSCFGGLLGRLFLIVFCLIPGLNRSVYLFLDMFWSMLNIFTADLVSPFSVTAYSLVLLVPRAIKVLSFISGAISLSILLGWYPDSFKALDSVIAVTEFMFCNFLKAVSIISMAIFVSSSVSLIFI